MPLRKKTEKANKILEALKQSEVKSRTVLGRGTLTMHAKDVTSTKKFQEYTEKASKLLSK